MKKDSLFTIRGIFLMAVITALFVVVLYSANLLPSLMDKGFAKQYGSIEEARRSLGNEHITIPSYFPEGIRWPPSFIVGQNKPFWGLLMEFQDAEKGLMALAIIQTDLKGSTELFLRLNLLEIKEEAEYAIRGRKARLKVGLCKGGIKCSSIKWEDKTRRFEIVSTSSPFETIKIAEGIMH